MFKRLLPAVLIAAALALVAIGGVAFATGRNSASDDKDELLDRVAAQLGKDPQVVKDAYAQAEREALKDKQDKVLADLVDRGVITQEEADSAGAWLDSRPAAADKLLESGQAIPLIIRAGVQTVLPDIAGSLKLNGIDDSLLDRMAEILGVEPDALRQALSDAGDSLQSDRMTQALNDMVDQMVKDGVLTQSEGDDIKAWIAQMPDWLKQSDVLGRLLNAGGPRMFTLPGDGNGPFMLPARPNGSAAPDNATPFQFYFNGPDNQFQFRGGPGDVPPDMGKLFDDLQKQFQFDFPGLTPPSGVPATPQPGGGDTPPASSSAQSQGA